jgi:hypothetical protein
MESIDLSDNSLPLWRLPLMPSCTLFALQAPISKVTDNMGNSQTLGFLDILYIR